ncbi:MAG: hypothetical protein FWE91_13015 [Defluviitaleaceae bacterium]|nr:hypothetical protein [Defluviitaleaceae bacterium]MCL2837015.1 hypothetical protein [Defluviitaleaceae bacterium]
MIKELREDTDTKIAIHSEFRGMGAGFMTLFTAGFKVVANWANMRKDCGM